MKSISIIIPVYNVEEYIERCIQSVIMQTFTDYEIILVDDASPDNALPIAENLLIENKIAFQTIKHKINQGLSEARNSGIKVAKGKYLMFIDSDDDLADKDTLKSFYQTIKAENCQVVMGRTRIVSGGKYSQHHRLYARKKILENTAILEAWMQDFIKNEAWNKLIEADFLHQHQLYFPKGYFYEDLPWVFNLYKKAEKICVLPKFTYNYYKEDNENAITSNVDKEKVDHLAAHFQYILDEIKKDEKLRTTLSKEDICRLVMGNVNGLLRHPQLMEDKKKWFYAYERFREVYKQSILYSYKKLFRLPSWLLFFVQKEIKRKHVMRGAGFYVRIIRILYRLNVSLDISWEDEIEVDEIDDPSKQL